MSVLCRRILLFAGIGILLNAASCWAQPLIAHTQSIESLVINSDRIWIGKIIKVRDEPIPGGSDKPGFTYEVEECLKLPLGAQPDLTIKKRGMFVAHPTTKYKDWMDRSCRLLIAFNEFDRNHPTIIELSPNKPEVFKADFTLLRDPEEVIQAAKAVVKSAPINVQRIHTFKLQVPHKAIKGTRWEDWSGLSLSVPIDGHLEKRAIKNIHSDDPWRRYQAVKALSHFKSEDNVTLLKSLLDDPAHNNGNEPGQRSYYIRDEARKTLERWAES